MAKFRNPFIPMGTQSDTGRELYNIRQPFVATCVKCGRTIYFDIDPNGTPGFNGDWGDGSGDWGCLVDNGDDSPDGNGHVSGNIRYDRTLYGRPKGQRKIEKTINEAQNG